MVNRWCELVLHSLNRTTLIHTYTPIYINTNSPLMLMSGFKPSVVFIANFLFFSSSFSIWFVLLVIFFSHCFSHCIYLLTAIFVFVFIFLYCIRTRWTFTNNKKKIIEFYSGIGSDQIWRGMFWLNWKIRMYVCLNILSKQIKTLIYIICGVHALFLCIYIWIDQCGTKRALADEKGVFMKTIIAMIEILCVLGSWKGNCTKESKLTRMETKNTHRQREREIWAIYCGGFCFYETLMMCAQCLFLQRIFFSLSLENGSYRYLQSFFILCAWPTDGVENTASIYITSLNQ